MLNTSKNDELLKRVMNANIDGEVLQIMINAGFKDEYQYER